MPLFSSLLLLLLVARVAGELAERLGQPSMIGEILAGIVLGPSLLGLVSVSPALGAISDLGVFFLVLVAGLEMDISELTASLRGRGPWIAALGFVVPLALGMIVAWAFGLDQTRQLFVGLCLAITALPVSVRILMDLGLLQSRLGRLIVAASVLNDTAALLVLGVILQAKATSGSVAVVLASTGLGVAKAGGLILLVIVVNRIIQWSYRLSRRTRRVVGRFVENLRGKETLFALAVSFVLAFAMVSEMAGLHFVAGAFFGALLLNERFIGAANFDSVRRTASAITMGFLGPIFFALIGLEFDVRTIDSGLLVVAVLAAAFAGKVLGGYWGGRIARLATRESWALGFGLNGRGVMELVIANIAYSNQFIGARVFAMLVLMTVVTTITTPIFLRWLATPDTVAA